MSSRWVLMVLFFLISLWLLPRHAMSQHRSAGHASNNSFHSNSGASRASFQPSFQRQPSAPSNFNFNNAQRGGNFQAQEARQQAVYAAQQLEQSRQRQQEAQRQQQAAQQQYRQQQEFAAQRAQQPQSGQVERPGLAALRSTGQASGQRLQASSDLNTANRRVDEANRARQEAESKARAARAQAVQAIGQQAGKGELTHPVALASEAAQLAHEKAVAARVRQAQQAAIGPPAKPFANAVAGSSSSTAQAALERALAARTRQTGESSATPVADTSPQHPIVATSKAQQAALERALAARAKHTPSSLGEGRHDSAANAGRQDIQQIKQHQQQALQYIAKQKTHITSPATFKAAQGAAISKLSPEQQAAVHAKVFHNESLTQANLRPSMQKPTLGKVQSSSLHLLPSAPGLAKLNTGQNLATKTGPTGRETITLPNGKTMVLDYTPTGHPRVRPPHLPVATLGAANAAGQRPASTNTNSATKALQALSGASGANAAVLTELIVGTIGEAILLGPGLFSGGGLSVPGGGGGAGGGGGFDDGGDDSGGCASAFDSGCVYVPNDDNADGGDVDGSNSADVSGNPDTSGNGVLLSVNSPDQIGGAGNAGSDSGASGADAAFNQPINLAPGSSGPGGDTTSGDGASDVSQTIYDAPSTKIDAVPQVGRYLNVINLSRKSATFHVQYHAEDQNGNWAWFPQSPEISGDAISFDLNPGQAVELWDGDWHVYADKARIWAISTDGQQQWNRYQSSDLLLVSETDDHGQPCYYSPDIQTLSFGLK